MKIGILIKNYNDLLNWELRIINRILKDPQLELSLLVKDGRLANKHSNSKERKSKRYFLSKNILNKTLFKIQDHIEKKIFKEELTVDRKKIFKLLKNIPTIDLNPTEEGNLDVFSNKDAKKIESFKLDIILRYEFNIIRGPILNSAKYGVWSFHYGDNNINHDCPTAFWEVLHKEKTIEVTLQQLTPQFDVALVIEKGYYNIHWSFAKTSLLAREASVSILFKNIRKLKKGNYTSKKLSLNSKYIYKTPNFAAIVKYMISFYKTLLIKAIEFIGEKIFGIRYNCYTIFIGKGQFMDSTISKLKPVKLPKNEYWADPFIFKYKNENYVFFENYDYKTKKGKISCGVIKKGSLMEISDVLDLDYHLSFPYIFEENNEIYLMPEASGNNRLEIFRCIEFPNKWELHSTAFENEKVADAFFFNDKNNDKWLFLNKKANIKNIQLDSELYIYKVDSLSLKKIEPHKQNPVIINSALARNGGSIFSYKNNIYRPSQANIRGDYGKALNINKIEKLTLNHYIERNIKTVYANFNKRLNSMHHLHQTDDIFVFDATYKKL